MALSFKKTIYTGFDQFWRPYVLENVSPSEKFYFIFWLNVYDM